MVIQKVPGSSHKGAFPALLPLFRGPTLNQKEYSASCLNEYVNGVLQSFPIRSLSIRSKYLMSHKKIANCLV